MKVGVMLLWLLGETAGDVEEEGGGKASCSAIFSRLPLEKTFARNDFRFSASFSGSLGGSNTSSAGEVVNNTPPPSPECTIAERIPAEVD